MQDGRCYTVEVSEANAASTGLARREKYTIHLVAIKKLSPRHRVVGGRHILPHALSPGLVPGERLPYELEGLGFPAGDG